MIVGRFGPGALRRLLPRWCYLPFLNVYIWAFEWCGGDGGVEERILLSREAIYGKDDYLLKISIVGPSRAGKTRLMQAMTGGPLWEPGAPYVETVGVDFKVVNGICAATAPTSSTDIGTSTSKCSPHSTVSAATRAASAGAHCNNSSDDSVSAKSALPTATKGKTAKVQLWDTSGAPRFSKLVASYIRSCNSGAIIVFDTTSPESFDLVRSHWYDVVSRQAHPDARRVLIGMTPSQETSAGVGGVSVSAGCAIDTAARQFASKNKMMYISLRLGDHLGAQNALKDVVREIAAQVDKRG
jgi:GTPase SAR1 family protein